MTELLDAKKERKELLKEMIKELHSGKNPEHLKGQFAELLRQVNPTEIANMEDNLIAEGMPESEIKRLCDVHVAVFKDTLDTSQGPNTPPGHPLHTFRSENDATEKVTTSIRELLAQMSEENNLEGYANALRSQFQLLAEIDKHYLRKENQLFPLLERHDVFGPPNVMWQTHDEIRAMLKVIFRALEANDRYTLVEKSQTLLKTIEDMIYKEENILFPMAFDILNEQEWGEVRHGEEEIGYTLVRPGDQWLPAAPLTTTEANMAQGENLSLSVGHLTAAQIDLLLTHLPIDLTFVDENDQVIYYSQGQERIFPRSPAIIGRKVQNCHPSDSVHIVNKILEEFKQGTKQTAEFWLEMNNRFIQIRYFAVRDQEGVYRGVLEVSQDVTDIRALTGEKRLLDW